MGLGKGDLGTPLGLMGGTLGQGDLGTPLGLMGGTLGQGDLGTPLGLMGGTLPFRFWGWDKGLGTPLGLMGGTWGGDWDKGTLGVGLGDYPLGFGARTWGHL